jgi:FkbM family methyltransferase
MCFYDLGAHIGFYSLMASKIVGSDGRVYSLEPDPDNFQICRETVTRNSLTNVEVDQFAVWERDELVRFHRQVGNRMSGGLEVPSRSRIGWVEEELSVQGFCLDSFAKDRMPPDVVKMDVEGAEQYALRGASELLATSAAIWFIEIHNTVALKECCDILRSMQFNIKQLGNEPEPPMHLAAFSEQLNPLASAILEEIGHPISTESGTYAFGIDHHAVTLKLRGAETA